MHVYVYNNGDLFFFVSAFEEKSRSASEWILCELSHLLEDSAVYDTVHQPVQWQPSTGALGLEAVHLSLPHSKRTVDSGPFLFHSVLWYEAEVHSYQLQREEAIAGTLLDCCTLIMNGKLLV